MSNQNTKPILFDQLDFGEKLELAFDFAEKSAKMIGWYPVTFATIFVDGIRLTITRNINADLPWFWRISTGHGQTKLLEDEWDLCYLTKEQL